MTTIKPVTIPREVAVAIETLRTRGYSAYALIDAVAIDSIREKPEEDTLYEYAIGNAELYLSALVNGYERELTEDEKRAEALRDYYGCTGNKAVVKHVLNTLGIVIPGINDAEGGAA